MATEAFTDWNYIYLLKHILNKWKIVFVYFIPCYNCKDGHATFTPTIMPLPSPMLRERICNIPIAGL